MKDISNHDENEDQNIIAATLADSINASHINALPQNDFDMMDVSHDRNSGNSGNNLNLGPQSKETARALRARKNLAVQKKRRPLPRIRRPRTPSPSSDSHSDEPDLNQHHTATKKGEGSRHSYRFLGEKGSDDPSPPGSPNISTKHHRSSSPIKGKKLGSMENPIDVDSIASLFEPTMIKEYVWLFFPYLPCSC